MLGNNLREERRCREEAPLRAGHGLAAPMKIIETMLDTLGQKPYK